MRSRRRSHGPHPGHRLRRLLKPRPPAPRSLSPPGFSSCRPEPAPGAARRSLGQCARIRPRGAPSRSEVTKLKPAFPPRVVFLAHHRVAHSNHGLVDEFRRTAHLGRPERADVLLRLKALGRISGRCHLLVGSKIDPGLLAGFLERRIRPPFPLRTDRRHLLGARDLVIKNSRFLSKLGGASVDRTHSPPDVSVKVEVRDVGISQRFRVFGLPDFVSPVFPELLADGFLMEGRRVDHPMTRDAVAIFEEQAKSSNKA